MSDEEIIRDELNKVIEEAKQLYNGSGKRVTGNWEKGLRVDAKGNKGSLFSYAYLAGRGPTRQGNKGEPTLVQRIEQWLRNRGIRPLESGMKISSLAFLIARKIHREGTNKDNHLEVFEKILTPERIQKIIDRVAAFNVSLFVNDVRVEFQKLTNNV